MGQSTQVYPDDDSVSALEQEWTLGTVFYKLVHVCVHCRKHFQFWLSTGLAIIFLAHNHSSLLALGRSNHVTAAQECTSSCQAVCDVPSAALQPRSANVSTKSHQIPLGYLDAPVSAAIFSTPTIEKRHTSDVWWMDPRQDSVYCSWGWRESDFDVFKNLAANGPDAWRDQMVLDKYVGTTRTTVWPRHEDKYYGSVADKVQDWLMLTPDPTVDVSMFLLAIWTTVGLYIILMGVIAILTALWYCVKLRREAYGTARYLLTMEALTNGRERILVRNACVLLCMKARNVPAVKVMELYLRVVIILTWTGAAVYSLASEASPVSRNLLHSFRTAKDIDPPPLPMPCYTTSHRSLCRLLTLWFMPERLLRRLKTEEMYDQLPDDADLTLIKALPLQDLITLRQLWRRAMFDDDSTARQKGVRQESRRNVSDMASVSSLDGGEGNINPMILAADEKAYRRLQSRGCLRELGSGFSKNLHLLVGLREYWILGLSLVHSAIVLTEQITMEVGFNEECKCSCTPGGRSIAECFNHYYEHKHEAASRLIRVVIPWVCGLTFIIFMLVRVWLARKLVGNSRFGTFAYILKLERVKATRRNRIIVLTAGSFAMFVTTLLILWAFLKTRNHAPTVQLVPHLFVLLQQAIAFFTLYTETSLLTKDVLQDVPEVEVPMGFWQPAKTVFSRLLPFIGMMDSEIRSMADGPERRETLAKKYGLSRQMAAYLTIPSILSIKGHLRTKNWQLDDDDDDGNSPLVNSILHHNSSPTNLEVRIAPQVRPLSPSVLALSPPAARARGSGSLGDDGSSNRSPAGAQQSGATRPTENSSGGGGPDVVDLLRGYHQGHGGDLV